jgi:hypothetical protein
MTVTRICLLLIFRFGTRKSWTIRDGNVDFGTDNKYKNTQCYTWIFFFNATTCPYGLRGPPHPGCGRCIADFWGWGAHRAQLRCPDDVSDDMCERGVPEGALNLNSTSYSDHSRYGDLPLQGKISTAEPGIDPGASWLVVRSPDHQATRLVICEKYCVVNKQPQTQRQSLFLIASDCVMTRTIFAWILLRMTDLSRLENVQTSSDGRTASYSMSTMGSFWGQSCRGFRMTSYQ